MKKKQWRLFLFFFFFKKSIQCYIFTTNISIFIIYYCTNISMFGRYVYIRLDPYCRWKTIDHVSFVKYVSKNMTFLMRFYTQHKCDNVFRVGAGSKSGSAGVPIVNESLKIIVFSGTQKSQRPYVLYYYYYCRFAKKPPLLRTRVYIPLHPHIYYKFT